MEGQPHLPGLEDVRLDDGEQGHTLRDFEALHERAHRLVAASKTLLVAAHDMPRGETRHSCHDAPRSTVCEVAVVDDSKARRLKLVGENIRRAREDAGLTQQQLGCRLDKTREYVNRWENAKFEPLPRHIEQLAEALDRPVWWFYQEHEDEAGE